MSEADVDAEVAREAAAADEKFHTLQGDLIVELRAHGVPDDEMPHVLEEAHRMYWQERCAIIERLRAALLRA